MSYPFYVLKFRDGEPAPMKEEVIRAVLGPVTVDGLPARGLPEWWNLRTPDGGEAEVHGDATCLSFTHVSGRLVLDRMAELARRTGAVVMPLDCPVLLQREHDRRHLPGGDLRADAIVVPPATWSGRAIEQVVRPLPEPPRRPVLPRFAYHSGAGAMAPSDEPCVCCGQVRGWVYTGPVYGAEAPSRGICPYCIAFGKAAERYGATFNDVIDGEVPDEVAREILERTPGIPSWQSPRWLTHCGDGAEFMEPAGTEELRHFPDAVEALRRECAEWGWSAERVDAYLTALDTDDQPTAYLFRCRVCGTHLACSDFT
ncbi:CbrC family protein [Streptomyces sp. NPDC058755]|uniref:CbrC family protein n=1 Tax=Streptomyces sp. NPDC058755 TaxID=3346624 RepID=UPI0036821391